MKLTAKLIIKGNILAETGLHIGGSKSSLDIGGVDLNVIKTPQGTPFIPGSSLKGKLRSLLARLEGSMAVNAKDAGEAKSDENFPYLLQLFGSSGDDNSEKGEVTRLLVRDAVLDEEAFDKVFGEVEMELSYTDIKWENTIDRRKGTAQHPRQLERVPAGTAFNFELVYDLYDDTTNNYADEKGNEEKLANSDKSITKLGKHLWAIETAMRLLQDDYLGGQGSRGYGKISFDEVKVSQKNITKNGAYSPGKIEVEVEQFQQSIQQL